MLYFCVRKVQFALSIELKKNTSFGLLHLSHWRLDLFCSWKMEWSHGKVMEKSLNFIPNFQYEPWRRFAHDRPIAEKCFHIIADDRWQYFQRSGDRERSYGN